MTTSVANPLGERRIRVSRFGLPMLGILVFVSVACPASLHGQQATDDTAARLDSLEKQRTLDRQYRGAVSRQEWGSAARALLACHELPFRIPMSFDAKFDTDVLVKRAVGYRQKEEGARWRKIRGSQSKAKAPENLMQSLDDHARSLYQNDDPVKVFRKLLSVTKNLDTQGFIQEYNWGRRLRGVLPYFPCDVGRLPPAARKTFKEEWRAASMPARRDFLKVAVLEMGVFGKRMSFLANAPRPNSKDLKKAIPCSPFSLQVAPERYVGKWVTFEGTLLGDDKRRRYPFSIKSLVPIQEIQPELLPLFRYDESDIGCMNYAGKNKLVKGLSGWTRGYPARRLGKDLKRLDTGTRVTISGRILKTSVWSPSHVLEVWQVVRVR